MRNAFENLKYIDEIIGEIRVKIIEKIDFTIYERNDTKKVVWKSWKIIGDSINAIDSYLIDDYYYVCHDNLIHKGKFKIQKGKLVVASKIDLLNFLRKEFQNNWWTYYIIAPKREIIEYAIKNNDEGTFFLISDKYLSVSPELAQD